MQTLYTVAIALVFLLAPAAVIRLCSKVSWLGKIGPVMVLYIIGLLIGNIFHPAGMAQVQEILSSAAVPVAIPLLLFGCTFKKAETRSQILALVTAIISVITATIIGFLIFGDSIQDGEKVGAMLTGVYTGGTMNLAALKTMLGADEATFILLNSCDMVISFIYLTVLMSFGIKLIRRWLPCETLEGMTEPSEEAADGNQKQKKQEETAKDVAILLGATVIIVALAGAAGLIAPEGWFMTIFILTLTTLGIAASFVPALHGRRKGEEIGMYAIYVFSITVASMADLRTLDISGSLSVLGYLALVVFGSLIINLILARVLRIDADTVTVASVSFICSPPFVPMITTVMKNKRVLAAGLGIGIIGYAAGNYLGFALYQLLQIL